MELHPWKLREAARCFREGGLLTYPTEAVFGLGCDPLNPDAVFRILALKQRPVDKGLILIASDFEQLRPFVHPVDDERMEQIFASWPGPNTWLLPTAEHLTYWLRGKHHTLAIRVTDHPVAAALCRACDSPLVSTSANLAGHPPARTPLDVMRSFNDRVDMVIHAPVGEQAQPSTITDALTGRIIRG